MWLLFYKIKKTINNNNNYSLYKVIAFLKIDLNRFYWFKLFYSNICKYCSDLVLFLRKL